MQTLLIVSAALARMLISWPFWHLVTLRALRWRRDRPRMRSAFPSV